MKQNIIRTTETWKKDNTDFGVWDKDIREDLREYPMWVIQNRCCRTISEAINKERASKGIKKKLTVTKILHEQEDWTTKLESFYTHFMEQIVNKPIEDKEIYLGQLIMIANRMKVMGMVKKDLSVIKK